MLRLLIVDDEESMLDGLRTMVNWAELGFELVGTFRDGRNAVAFLSENPIDVVLTDIRMPHMSGIDIAAHIHDKGLPVRVVLLSGYRDFEAARAAMRYGVSHYVTKPFMLKTLRDVMGEVAEEIYKNRTAAELNLQAQRHMEEMREFMRERFFIEAASGALRHQYMFDRWVEILRIDEKQTKVRCTLFSLIWDKPISELRRVMLHHFPEEFACAFRLKGPAETRLLCLADARFGERLQEVLGPVGLHRLVVANSVRELSLMDHLEGASGEDALTDNAIPGEDNAATAACAYIQAHYNEKLSLTDVARHVHLNPAYLSRMFSEQTGYSFRDYLANTRVQAAARILVSTRMQVYAVCEAVGYNDIKHFYKIFKQIMGVTPTEYREMAGRTELPDSTV